jgi:hypothetical protein
MTERPDKDEIERATTSPGTPRIEGSGAATLPVNEPGQRSIDEQRRDLLRTIEELEGSLRYMGSGHPLRSSTQKRLAHLRAMLAQVEAVSR